ncbi:MAG: hypothetical protein SGPRY_003225, partial [Prymnesium sp.]
YVGPVLLRCDYSKYTTLCYTAGLAPSLRPLRGAVCVHAPGSHESAAGGLQHPDGKWNSVASAAYPADLNLFFAEALASLVVQLQPIQDDPDASPKEPLTNLVREIISLPPSDPTNFQLEPR